MTGWMLPAVQLDIIDTPSEPIKMMLPSGVSLVAVSVYPDEQVPRTTVMVSVRDSAHPTRLVYLKKGVAHNTGDTHFAYSWVGNLPLDKDYEHELWAHVFNRTGSTKRWIMTAVIDDGKGGPK